MRKYHIKNSIKNVGRGPPVKKNYNLLKNLIKQDIFFIKSQKMFCRGLPPINIFIIPPT